MNIPFIHYSTKNKHRPYCLMVRNNKGDYERLSGWFSNESSLMKYRDKWNRESPVFFCR